MARQRTEKITLGQTIAAGLKHEAAATGKMPKRFPAERADWTPREKSIKMAALASHIADVPNWIPPTVTPEELDFSRKEYKPLPGVYGPSADEQTM